jgi:hypothetical protein
VALHVIASDGGEKIEKRKDERRSGNGRVLALHIDGSPHAFALENISAGGLMGPALPGINDARELVVELEDGTFIPAELKWLDGAFAGLAFVSEPIING